jgi:hypothetical protein
MMIGAIYDSHLDRRFGKTLRGLQTTETGPNNDYARSA